jgi:hypothetical protein
MDTAVGTEIRGFELHLRGADLFLQADDRDLVGPIRLDDFDAERLRLELAKAQLWEWNQLAELRSRAALRYRRYLASWLVLCLAAFSAYVSYPSYYICIFLALLSMFLWWRAGYVEREADREAQDQRRAFVADWNYIRERLEESEITPAGGEAE